MMQCSLIYPDTIKDAGFWTYVCSNLGLLFSSENVASMTNLKIDLPDHMTVYLFTSINRKIC